MNEQTLRHDTASHQDNTRVQDIERIITPANLIEKYPLDHSTASFIEQSRSIISNIIHLKDDRLLVITWPCSIHNPEEALQIAEELKILQENNPHLYIVMRTYFEKPRTTVGWKGLINDPKLDESCDINTWLNTARELLLKINKMWVPTAIEFLDTITPQYIADLIHWGAIGARTTESQEHRKLVSWLSMPVGFKNGMTGDDQIAIDAIQSAQNSHSFLGNTKGWDIALITTKWNSDGHVVLRGWYDWPNYDKDNIKTTTQKLKDTWIETGIIVDLSHGNSRKNHKNQPIVCDDIAKQVSDGNKRIVWVMIEANIHEWSQSHTPWKDNPNNIQPWISITDKCVSLETNRNMVENLELAVKDRREKV